MVSIKHIVHDFGFLCKVMARCSQSFSGVDFVGNGHFSPGDPEPMGESNVFPSFGGGGNRLPSGWVPPKA